MWTFEENDVASSDWLKGRNWEWATTLDEFLRYECPHRDKTDQVKWLEKQKELPYFRAAPESLKAEVEAFISVVGTSETGGTEHKDAAQSESDGSAS